MKRRLAPLAVLAALAVACIAILGLFLSKKRNQKPVVILISGDTGGWITPCGCAANQSGGLARRAELVQQTKLKNNVVLLDAGGSASGTSEYHQLKLEHILVGLRMMGLDAHNLGGPECKLSPNSLRKLGESSRIQWVSANVSSKEGSLPAIAVQVIERDGLRFAVTGVCDPTLPHHSDLVIAEPKQSVLRALKEVQADVRIVLAYFDQTGLTRLKESLPEVDYVIGGPTGQVFPPTRVGSGYIMSSTNKGKFLASIELSHSGDKKQRNEPRMRTLEVLSSLNESSEQLSNLQRFYRELSKRDFRAEESGIESNMKSLETRNDAVVAGSTSCRKCHAGDCEHWESTKHGHAWQVLKAKNAQFDPYCQQCHATGYGLAGGFINVALTEDRVNVGCENCHGPSRAHVEKPTVHTPYPAAQQCIRCHDHENSPQFEYTTYWPKVQHGKKSP